MMRRRLAAASALLLALGGAGALDATLGNAAPEVARQHIELTKLCPLSAAGGAQFTVKNMTLQFGPAETITVTLKDRYVPNLEPGAKGLVKGTVEITGKPTLFDTATFTLAPGETALVTAGIQGPGDPTPGKVWPWVSPYKPAKGKADKQYFAHFTVVHEGMTEQMRTHEFCACKKPQPPQPTTTVPPTTVPPTTTPDTEPPT